MLHEVHTAPGADRDRDDASPYQSERTVFERGVGPDVVAALANPDVLDVAINPDGGVFAELSTGERVRVGEAESTGVQTAVQTVAHVCRRELGRNQPQLTARLPWTGSRFSAELYPRFDMAPAVSIRKHGALHTRLGDYVGSGGLTEQDLSLLRETVTASGGRNILFCGATGSGKTTAVNAYLHEVHALSPDDRIYAIEEVAELSIENRDLVAVECEKHEFRDKFVLAMRMNPSRIVIGEVRGDEALELVLAWSGGHRGGCATVHAHSAAGGLRRLSMLAELALGRPLPDRFVADAVDVIVHMRRGPGGRREFTEIGFVEFDETNNCVRVRPSQGGKQ